MRLDETNAFRKSCRCRLSAPCVYSVRRDFLDKKNNDSSYFADTPLECENHIWILDRKDCDPAALFQFLSRDEMQTSTEIGYEKRRHEFIASQAFLRAVISKYIPLDPVDLFFDRSGNGKPHLQSPYSAIKFNLSHCDTAIAVAISSSGEIGVDIESMQIQADECHALAKRFFSKREAAWIMDAGPDKCLLRFQCVFTQKEACLKCKGDGLRFPLDDFDIILSDISFASSRFMLETDGLGCNTVLSSHCAGTVSRWRLFRAYPYITRRH